ncbi:DUF3147 family protein [Herbidospora sp. NEAU-GS84]|uniref:DUF3147 family protein n=1 Tax=Herbidospora solisilvae TaxID=2696284 RepID=A0A7C9J9Q0_9ACTN|nr:DUF3147 family protein [Herbidospora solisilvae]NAS20624.1 DUF3147 family protein [Herbidospora solisilvae]
MWLIVARAVFGGVLVMGFALLGEATSPKRFAGIFAAAPAVAIGGMVITALSDGRDDLAESGLGMVAGGVALVAYCALAVPLVRRFGALKGSAGALLLWAAVAWLGWTVVS